MQIQLDGDLQSFATVLEKIIARRGTPVSPPLDSTRPLSIDDDVWSALDQGGFIEAIGPHGDRRMLGLAAEKFGYGLTPVPLVAYTLASHLASEINENEDFLGDVIAGKQMVGVCEVSSQSSVTIDRHPDGAIISGLFKSVLGGLAAKAFFLVDPAQPEDLWILDAKDAQIQPLAFDLTRDIATVEFNRAKARQFNGDIGRVWHRAKLLGQLVECGELVGSAQGALQMTIEHVSTRHQFGRPIGSFQAPQHMLAQVALDNEAALAAVRWACREVEQSGDRFDESRIHIATATTMPAVYNAARTAVQLHGGMGFTWEHRAHLYLRRARSAQNRFMSEFVAKESIADHVLVSLT